MFMNAGEALVNLQIKNRFNMCVIETEEINDLIDNVNQYLLVK